MRLSLNEVEVTARKAALGAGLPLGLAEEAGTAAAWLAAAGLPVERLLSDALKSAGDDAVALSRSGEVHAFASPTDVSALRFAPSACDLVLAAARAGKSVMVEAVFDVPLLAVAQAAVASAEAGLPLAVEIGGELRALAQGRSSVLLDAPDRLAEVRLQLVTVRLLREGDRNEACARDPAAVARARDRALAGGVGVDAALWSGIQALAARTLVPATTRSRERGAGAGLNDTD